MTDIWHATWRAVLGILMALLVTRYLNKQFVARLTYFDFTLGVLVGSLAGHIPNDYRQPLFPVAVPLLVVMVVGIIIGWVAMRYERFRHLLEGEPTVIIQNGKLLEDNMRRLRYNLDQLNSQLRTKGIWDVAHVEFAVLEPGGGLSVLPKSQHKPVTPADLHIPTRYDGMPIELIMDGTVIHKNLQENNLSEEWLRGKLAERGIDDPANVFFAVLNTRGDIFVDLYDDRINRPVDLEGLRPSTPPTPNPIP
jgi:uncharacterized membrane protein YcaP (DUF421 family)